MNKNKFFLCKKCGNCCKQGFVYLTNKDIKSISACLKINIDQFYNQYTEYILWIGRVLKFKDDKCVFLNNNNYCLIYDVRPEQCKKFPYWDWIIKKKNWQDEIKEFCKGVY